MNYLIQMIVDVVDWMAIVIGIVTSLLLTDVLG